MERDRKHSVNSGGHGHGPLNHIPHPQGVIDQSAALALTKLSNKANHPHGPHKRYLSSGSSSLQIPEEASASAQHQQHQSRGVIYNHKHLQYIPPPKRSPSHANMSPGSLSNGRAHVTQHQQLYPPSTAPGPMMPGRPGPGQGQDLRGPLTKSVGVGANLNYARGGQMAGRAGGLGHPQNHNSNPPNLPDHLQDSGIRPEIVISPSTSYGGLRPGEGSGSGRTQPGKNPLPGTGIMPGSLSNAQIELLISHYKGNGNKIVSQNLNGTLSVTGVPTNDSELQLFRVLQRANLLNYFDVMIELGGDDVQQLCDAGEEEFLEIMALIGMASKPLHVRRLQKSLQEWMTQPNLFPSPTLGPPLSAFTAGHNPNNSRERTNPSPNPNPLPGNQQNSNPNPAQQLPIRPIPCQPIPNAPGSGFLTPNELKSLQLKFHNGLRNESSGSDNSNSPIQSNMNPHPVPQAYHPHLQPPPHPNYLTVSSPSMISNSHSPGPAPSPFGSGTNSGQAYPPASSATSPCPSSSSSTSSSSHHFTLPNGISLRIPADQLIPSHFLETRLRTRSEPNSPAESPQPQSHSQGLDSRSSVSPIPFLQDHEVEKITESAIRVLQSLPDFMGEPRVTAKRKSSADFETVIRLAEDDPNTMDEIRKYAAIYGRYDCKRKVQKPLTIHELSLNEAASQLCKRIPALLTRREELLQLSRQAVRDAGLPYSSIITIPGGNMFPTQNSNMNNGRVGMGAKPEDAMHSVNGDHGNGSYLNGRKLRNRHGMEIQEYNRPRSAPDTQMLPEEMSLNIRRGSGPAVINTQSSSNSHKDLMIECSNSRKRSASSNSPGEPKDRKLDEPKNAEPDDLSITNSNRHQDRRISEGYNSLNVNNNNNNTSKSANNVLKPEPIS